MMELTVNQINRIDKVLQFIKDNIDNAVSDTEIIGILNTFNGVVKSSNTDKSLDELSQIIPITRSTYSVVMLCMDSLSNSNNVARCLEILHYASLSSGDQLILLVPLSLGFIAARDNIDNISLYKQIYRYINSTINGIKNNIKLGPIGPSDIIENLIPLSSYLGNSPIEHHIESLKFDLFGKFVDLMGNGLNEDNNSTPHVSSLLDIFNVSLIGVRLSNVKNNTGDDSTSELLHDMIRENNKINDKLISFEPVVSDILSLINRFYDYVLSDMFTTDTPDNNRMNLLKFLEFNNRLCQVSKYHIVVCYYMSHLLKLLKSKNINDNIVDISAKIFELIKASNIDCSIDIGSLSMIVKEIQSSEYWNPKIKLNCSFRTSLFTRYSNQDNDEPKVVHENFVPDLTNQRALKQYLTEGFTIEADGTIKVKINSKQTFIAEYSENHRLLKLNEKLGDYEGMKYNLVYHLMLINNLEQNVIHGKGVSDEIREDANKAIRFAKNDISIYLPKLKAHCKNFDLNRFYKEVKADKNTIEIDTVSTVSGIKRIIKTILL